MNTLNTSSSSIQLTSVPTFIQALRSINEYIDNHFQDATKTPLLEYHVTEDAFRKQWMRSKEQQDVVKAAWSLLFLSTFNHIQCNPEPLQIISSNAYITSFKASLASVMYGPRAYFMKLVPREFEKSYLKNNQVIDDVVVEAINGCIINNVGSCCHRVKLSEHLQKFFGVFKTFISKDNYWNITEQVKLDDDKSPFNEINRPSETYDVAKACVYMHINGFVLADLLIHPLKKLETAQKLRKLFPEFLTTLNSIAFQFGMVHNDLHVGNVMLKTDEKGDESLVIIDFGRTHMGTVSANFNHILNIFAGKLEDCPTKGVLEYHDYINKKLPRHCLRAIKYPFNKQSEEKEIFVSGIADVMSITLSIAIHEYDIDQNNLAFMLPMMNLIRSRENDVVFEIPDTVEHIFNGYETIITKNENNQYNKTIATGLLYFTLFMFFVQVEINQKDANVVNLYRNPKLHVLPSVSTERDYLHISMEHMCANPFVMDGKRGFYIFKEMNENNQYLHEYIMWLISLRKNVTPKMLAEAVFLRKLFEVHDYHYHGLQHGAGPQQEEMHEVQTFRNMEPELYPRLTFAKENNHQQSLDSIVRTMEYSFRITPTQLPFKDTSIREPWQGKINANCKTPILVAGRRTKKKQNK